MVMLRDKQMDEFPWFHLYLEMFCNVRYESKIWEPFLEWSGLSDDDALRAVSYGTFPIVNVNKDMNSSGEHGKFNPNSPDNIWIERDKVQGYERTTDPTREWMYAKYMEMLILHELVHWARHQGGLGDDFYVDGMDSGRAFATEAYNDVAHPHLG